MFESVLKESADQVAAVHKLMCEQEAINKLSTGVNNLVETAGHLYHATTQSAAGDIQKNGITPQKVGVWTGAVGQDLRDKGAIYAWDNFDDAGRWAFKTGYDTGQEAVVIVLKDNGKWAADEHFQSNMGVGKGLKMKGSVPPEDILRVIPITPELTRALAQSLGGTPVEEPVG